MARRSEKRSIFHNLVKDEVTLTQAFCNFLRMECFKDVFIGLINEKREKAGYELLDPRKIRQRDFKLEVVSTEQRDKRVDLVLYYNDEEYFFEVKINPNTSLTKNQPDGYLGALKNDYKRLYFILPRNYYHKNEIYKRMRIKNIKLAEEVVDNQILYWEDIAKEIKRIAANGANPLLQEFYDILWSKWIGYEKVEFDQKEIDLIYLKIQEGGVSMFDSTIPAVLQKMIKVIEGVRRKYEDKIKKHSYINQDQNFYGYYLKPNGYEDSIEIFFGIDYEIWQERGCPFIIEIFSEDDEVMEKIKKDIASRERFDYYQYKDPEMGEVIYTCLQQRDISQNIQEKDIVEKFQDLLETTMEIVKKSFSKNE